MKWPYSDDRIITGDEKWFENEQETMKTIFDYYEFRENDEPLFIFVHFLAWLLTEICL
jgi:hypothetical protein